MEGEKEALRGQSMRCSPAVHLPNLKRRSANDFPGRLLPTDGAREERRRRESRKIRLQHSNVNRWSTAVRKLAFNGGMHVVKTETKAENGF